MMTKGINPFYVFLFILIYSSFNKTYSQGDITVLGLFQVIDSLTESKKDITSFRFDSLQYSASNGIDGGEFINRNTGIYVKDYGPGTTTTLSYRGNSASHTKVYWEGISVDNAMLGMSDLSLISFSNEVNIDFLKAGNSVSLGSGGFGGILNVSSGKSEWTGFSADLGISYGSFNTKIIPVNIFIGNGKWKFEAQVTHTSSDNNYPYTNYLDGNKIETMQNNAFNRIQFMPKISYKLNKNNQLSFSYWYTESNRQVPNIIGIPAGDAKQSDLWNRAMAQWKYEKGKVSMNLKSSVINDEMYYENKTIGIDSENEVFGIKNLMDIKIKLRRHFISESQVKYDYIEVLSNNYNSKKIQNIISLNEAISYQTKFAQVKVGLRAESPEANKFYLMPSINMGITPIKKFTDLWLYGSAGYNVRYPSFNELYWQNIGNPNLKEESSKSYELGVEQKFRKSKTWNLSMLFNVYYSEIQNLIVWVPNNSSIWTPQNVKEVENKGFEIESKLKLKKKKCTTFIRAGYTYTSSITKENIEYPEFNGYQQIYVPLHKLQGTISLSWNTYFLSYNQVYTGMTFVSTDNGTYLPYSAPASLEIGKNIKMKESMVSVSFSVNNLYNEDYQYVAHRPMPLRNYLFKILYHIN